MKLYQLADPEIEDLADLAKSVVIAALVNEGIIDKDIGEKWAETHTVLRRHKSFFRTITDRWLKSETSEDTYIYTVVKSVLD